MKINQLSVTAVIPTAQYANLQPTITIEVNDDYDEAKKEAMKQIAQFSSDYAEDGKSIGGATTTKKLKKMKPYIGDGEVFFDKDAHAYCDKDGKVFQSGSQFAKQFEHEFNVDMIAKPYAAKWEEEEQTIKDFWRAKGDASTTFGTALHQALETHGKFHELAEKLSTEDKPVTTGINPTFAPIVDAFFTPERLTENAVYEPFVSSNKLQRCGQIDRLVIVDESKKICDIEDYKTNADLYKKGSPKFLKAPYDTLLNQPVSTYTLQLNFYRTILEAAGWTVRNLILHHWDGEVWAPVKLNKVEI